MRYLLASSCHKLQDTELESIQILTFEQTRLKRYKKGQTIKKCLSLLAYPVNCFVTLQIHSVTFEATSPILSFLLLSTCMQTFL